LKQLPVIYHQNNLPIQQRRQPSNIQIGEVLEFQSQKSRQIDDLLLGVDHYVVGGEVASSFGRAVSIGDGVEREEGLVDRGLALAELLLEFHGWVF
jgi:hypothetical protein